MIEFAIECNVMRGLIMISSSSNAQIKNLTKLIQKAKARREEGAFVVEGRKMFLEVPEDLVKSVYISESLISDCPENIKKKLDILIGRNISVETVADNVFKSVSDTVSPQGILSVAAQPSYSLEQFLNTTAPLFMLLEDLQDPGNLGTIMRTAEGAGVTAVIMSKGTVDLFNPKVTRSTMGAIFRVPFVYVEDLNEVVDKFHEKGIKTYAAHLMDSVDYVKCDYRGGTAFLVGNEGNGLTEKLCDAAGNYIKIPMAGEVESLNASVAAALLMYEAYRQRRE